MSIAVLATVLALAETIRTCNRWIVPFMLVVVAGNGMLTTTVKGLADRARPALNPTAHTLGPSFPSGHSSWSAPFLAATVLVLSRGRRPSISAVLAGTAAGLAVSIAATRVLLAVHWLSDAIAGLALGWGLVRRVRHRLLRPRTEVRRPRRRRPSADLDHRSRVARAPAPLTRRRIQWAGVDVIPCENGLIKAGTSTRPPS